MSPKSPEPPASESRRGVDQPPEMGERLTALEQRLRLLMLHLAGPAVRARVDLEDLIQEVYLRAVGARAGLPPYRATHLAVRMTRVHTDRVIEVVSPVERQGSNYRFLER